MKERLMNDLKQAMKDKDTLTKDTIQMVRAQILQTEKDKQVELNNDDIITIIAKQQKQKQDSLKDFEKAGREDLVEQTKQEMDILTKYLPEPITIDKIRECAAAAYGEHQYTKKEMGIFIKEIKTLLGPAADGKLISEVVKEILNKGE